MCKGPEHYLWVSQHFCLGDSFTVSGSIYFTVANSDNFLFALKKIISVKPVITAHDSFRIETAYPALHYSIRTHGKRANSFSNRFLCLNANMANNHKKMLLLYLIFPWSF